MFTLSGKMHYIIQHCTNMIIYRNYVRKIKPATNAGLGKRLKMLEDTENIDINDEQLDFDEYESDFSTVSQSYGDYEQDMSTIQQRQKQFLIKRKYFKEYHYNFLTWSEKEQIKYLNRTDPVQYSIERLAETFPASNDVISKILKSNWKMQNPDRIIKHDKAVEKNWSLLQKGEIPLSKEYKDHILKFTSREKVVLNENQYSPTEHLQSQNNNNFTTTSTEFSSIIQNFNDMKKETNKIQDDQASISELTQSAKPLQDTYVMDSKVKKTSKLITFSKFKQNMENTNEGKDITPSEIRVQPNTKSPTVIEENPIQIFDKPFHSNNSLSGQHIANFIRIPRKLWKKGQTYKVDDCFYDDDGEFLYRVPGLMNKSNNN